MINYVEWKELDTRNQILYIGEIVSQLKSLNVTDAKVIKDVLKLRTNNDSKFLKILELVLNQFKYNII